MQSRWMLAAVALTLGCQGVAQPTGDSGSPDAGGSDAGRQDAQRPDVAADTRVDDGVGFDGAAQDSGGADDGVPDVAPIDGAAIDGARVDAAAPDTGRADAGGPTTTRYVATTGSDATGTGSMAAPWATIQKAVDTAPGGSVIDVASGTYAPFRATRPDLTVTAAPAAMVVVAGAAGVRDVILIAANNVTVSNLTVRGCVPNSAPAGGFESGGSSGVRVDDGTSGAVVSQVVIRDSDTTHNADGLPFGCYAVMVHNATNATIADSEMYHNGYGIFVNGGGSGVRILRNRIHDNDVIIRNTSGAGNDDYGAVAIGFDGNTSDPGPTADGNTIYNNQGPSHDYGTDGGAFEIYQASYVTMTNNTLYNNENVLESGAGSGGACNGNVFTGNTARGPTAGSTLTHAVGMILRCAHNMTVTNNTLTTINWWVFEIEGGGTFGASITGLTITGNRVDQTPPSGSGATSEKTYSLNIDPAGMGLVVDHNQFHYVGAFGNDWHGGTEASLAAWQGATGFDAHSTTF